MRPECVLLPMVIVALFPVMVSVASISGSSPCFNFPVYVPERSVCSCCIGSHPPVRRFIGVGVAAAIAPVSAAASGEGFGRGRRWRGLRGFAMLLFEGAIVVEEFEFCAETTRPVAATAIMAATISIRYLVVLFFTVVLLF